MTSKKPKTVIELDWLGRPVRANKRIYKGPAQPKARKNTQGSTKGRKK